MFHNFNFNKLLMFCFCQDRIQQRQELFFIAFFTERLPENKIVQRFKFMHNDTAFLSLLSYHMFTHFTIAFLCVFPDTVTSRVAAPAATAHAYCYAVSDCFPPMFNSASSSAKRADFRCSSSSCGNGLPISAFAASCCWSRLDSLIL